MKNKIAYKNLLLMGCFILLGGLSSCTDFLTVVPTDRIYKFWEDKTDLESAVAGCYKQQLDCETNMLFWGESRSDNFDLMSEDWKDMKDYMNANLTPKLSYAQWTNFYKTISYCNVTLEHGAEVVDKDPSFSIEDWYPIRAEMKGLRALNYFYVLRAFRDIPYTTKSVGTDKEALAMRAPQSSPMEVLNFLISDLDSVKDEGMVKFPSAVQNKGRLTKWGIYTLLADIYLWRASMATGMAKAGVSDTTATDSTKTKVDYLQLAHDDYAKVVECCDAVLDHYVEEYKKNHYGQTNADNPYDMAQLQNDGLKKGVEDDIYATLFARGNAMESIFELQHDEKNGNQVISNITNGGGGGSDWSGKFQASTPCQTEGVDEMDPKNQLFGLRDIRRWQTFAYMGNSQKTWPLAKYGPLIVTHKDLDKNSEGAEYETKPNLSQTNWIVYRLSEVLFMKAEALNYLEDSHENREKALELIKLTLNRANPTIANDDTKKLKIESYDSQSDMADLILRERRRELFAEGKRWFDLVRLAERNNSTTAVVNFLLPKYTSNANAIKAKLSSIYSLYNPVHEDQMKLGDFYKQNPVWDNTKENIQHNY